MIGAIDPIRKMVLPRRIIQLRRLHRFSQAQLARSSGLNVSTINSIESGLHDPRCSTIELIAKAFYVLPGYLLGYDLDLESPASPGTVAADQMYAYQAGLLQAAMSPPALPDLCAGSSGWNSARHRRLHGASL
jgi:transcriptional regulator with XRE-family HTH domain